ncbi:MAG: hypothetical protein V1788_00795 [Nanoarchaeota archaeon]
MTAQNSKDIKNKASIIASIMNHSKLSKTISDAFSAPLGSTKRDNARKILRSLNKVNNNYRNVNDGQGGAVMNWANQNIMNPAKNYVTGLSSSINTVKEAAGQQGMQFLKSIDIATPLVESQRQEADPNKYMLDKDGNIVGLQPTAFGKSNIARTAAFGLNVAGEVGMGLAKAPEKAVSAVSNIILPGIEYIKTWVSEDPELNKVYSNLIDVNGEVRTVDGEVKFGSEEELAKYLDIAPNQIDWNKIKKTGTATGIAGTAPTTPTPGTLTPFNPKTGEIGAGQPTGTKPATAPNYTGIPIVSGDNYTYVNKDGTVYVGKLGDNYIDNTTYAAPPEGTGKFDYNQLNDPNFGSTGYWMSQISQSPENAASLFNSLGNMQSLYGDSYAIAKIASGTNGEAATKVLAKEGTLLRRAQDASNSMEGRTSFINSELLDKERLSETLKIDANIIPDVFLQDTKDRLASALNKEYSIDLLRDDLTAKVNAGLTVEQDFTSYIRGKDEYLKKIDDLLDDANMKIANMDTSNPYVAQRCKYYTNYLTILKGRQNQRYIDFLDLGIKQWNAEITQEQNLYNSNYAKYKLALESKVGTATEWDKMIRDMLGEMYDSIEKMEDRQIKIESAERDKIKDNTSIALDILKLQRGGVESTQTERDRMLKTQTLQGYVDKFEVDTNDRIKIDSYLANRTNFVTTTGFDVSIFDDAFGQYLSDTDQVSLGLKKATDTSLTTDYDALVNEWKNIRGWNREQIEKEYKSQEESIPYGLTIALDKAFPESKKGGLFGWGTGFGL